MALNTKLSLGLAEPHKEPVFFRDFDYTDGRNTPVALFTLKYRAKSMFLF